MNSKEFNKVLNKLPFDFEIQIENSVNGLGNISELAQVVVDTYGFFGNSLPCYILKSVNSNTLVEDNDEYPSMTYSMSFVRLVRENILDLLNKTIISNTLSFNEEETIFKIKKLVNNWDINTIIFEKQIIEYVPSEINKDSQFEYFNKIFDKILSQEIKGHSKDYFNHFIAPLFLDNIVK